MEIEIKEPTKGIKNICKQLGNEYCIRLFDFEQVIYRDFGNGYDVEVSGLNHNRKTFKATIYVWNAEKNHIVKTISNIDSIELLAEKLSEVTAEYSVL